MVVIFILNEVCEQGVCVCGGGGDSLPVQRQCVYVYVRGVIAELRVL